MDELIYLSNAKLAQFVPLKESAWARLRFNKVKAGLSAAGAKVEIEASIQDQAKLRKVMSHIEETARWYEDERVLAGEWVFFERQLIHVTTDDFASGGGFSAVPDTTLFYDTGEGAGRPRLLLHGSTRHLLGKASSGKPKQGQDGPDEASPFPSHWNPSDMGILGIFRLLESIGDRSDSRKLRKMWAKLTREDAPPPRKAADYIEWIIRNLDDMGLGDSYAAWMGGCARVTSRTYLEFHRREIIMASPLYVQRVPPPE